MKAFAKNFVIALFSALATIVFTNAILFAAEEKATGTLTITATVRPVRILVVNPDLTIQEIVSNTSLDVRPLVVANTMDGPELPYSEAIRQEYAFIKPGIDFSKPGIVYRHEDRFFQAVIKRTARTLSFLSPF